MIVNFIVISITDTSYIYYKHEFRYAHYSCEIYLAKFCCLYVITIHATFVLRIFL